MASIIKANQLQDFGGNSILTSDGSGVVTPNASGIKSTPAFEAYLGSDQTGISDATYTKVQFNTETFDTDSTYDNSTNYRFTPAVEGKYYIYGNLCLQTTGGHELNLGITSIYLNGTLYRSTILDPNTTAMISCNLPIDATMNLSATDYVEIFAYIERTSGGSRDIKSGSKRTYFGAYKIIGA
jgi:hypothetical protein|tara:strand:+ start:517 stop:1065 length:549 start_codon:yes stop_codon:yes gene_type:complete